MMILLNKEAIKLIFLKIFNIQHQIFSQHPAKILTTYINWNFHANRQFLHEPFERRVGFRQEKSDLPVGTHEVNAQRSI
jgi:hypothetical protein